MLTAISMSAIATNGVVPGMISICYVTLTLFLFSPYLFLSQLLFPFSWWLILHDLQSIRPRVWRSSGFVFLPGHHICRFYVHTRNHGNIFGESKLGPTLIFSCKPIHTRSALVQLTRVSRFYQLTLSLP